MLMPQNVTKVLAAYVRFHPRSLRHHYQILCPRGLNFRVFRDPSQSRSWEFSASRFHWPVNVKFHHYMRVITTETLTLNGEDLPGRLDPNAVVIHPDLAVDVINIVVIKDVLHL